VEEKGKKCVAHKTGIAGKIWRDVNGNTTYREKQAVRVNLQLKELQIMKFCDYTEISGSL